MWSSRREFEIPMAQLTINQVVNLPNTVKNPALEALVVKNVAELQEEVSLSLLDGMQGYYEGPPIKIEYARPSHLPGQVRKLGMSPFAAPPR
jgi:hypothetical protein